MWHCTELGPRDGGIYKDSWHLLDTWMVFEPFTVRENSVEAAHAEMHELWMGGGVSISLSLPSGTFFLAWHYSCSPDQSEWKEHSHGTYFSTKDGVKTETRQFQETDKNISVIQKDGDVLIMTGCEKRCHSSTIMDLTSFKDSFSNIRLEIHLALSQWDHTDTITSISFHYCISRFKWHIYILSTWELDKQPEQIGLERRGAQDLSVDFCSEHWHQGPVALIGPVFLLPSFSCSARVLTAQLNSLNSDFLSDQKMTNEVFTR